MLFMDNELRLALIKWFIIVALTIVYIAFMILVVSPWISQIAYGQSAFDVPNQFANPQYNQYGGQQFQQPYQDPYSQQYQQPYGQQQYYDPYQQQYGMTPYQQQPYYGTQPSYVPQYQSPIQFGTSEIVYTLLGGGALGYARYNQHKRNQDKDTQRELMAELLKEKQEKRELARVVYDFNQQKAEQLNDAPNIKLENLDKGIQQFSEKVAKA